MKLTRASDLFKLQPGNLVSKNNLYELIQYSKVQGSPFYDGEDQKIGNTPQQGINWVGELPAVGAVIIKTKPGSYVEDGWVDGSKEKYNYSFKARNDEVNYEEKANKVLIKQPQHNYPIFLFSEVGINWDFIGSFDVIEIQEKYVCLQKSDRKNDTPDKDTDESIYQEGDRYYVTHLMIERNKKVVKELKATSDWVCNICGLDFHKKYKVKYIEAHHIVPVSTYSSTTGITFEDFALLCPNCHKATHLYMKNGTLVFEEIKEILKNTG